VSFLSVKTFASHARPNAFAGSRRSDGRLPSSKRGVSILQLWCILNACVSNVDLHSTNLGDHGGQHGQESEEGKEEDSQEEKEVTVRRKPYGLRIASEVRYTFATRTGGSFRLQNIRTAVRPDRYANGCCITVRVFICANRLSPRMKPVHAAAESALPPMNGHRPFDP
jgi:hypothetical protein